MKYSENLEAWKALVLAARAGSITRAATLMDCELPKMSRLLGGLEREMGFPFFDKSHRPVQMTTQCRELVRTVEPFVAGFERVRGSAWGGRELTKIRFAAPVELSQLYFSEAVVRYAADNPGVQFSVCPEVRASGVRAGDVDVAIINHLPSDTTGLNTRLYSVSGSVALASPGYLERYGEPRTIEDLKDHRGLLQNSPNMTPSDKLFRDGQPSAPIRWKSVFHTTNQLAIKQLVMDGQGIALDLYLGHVVDEINSGEIVPILPGWRRKSWHMHVVTRTEDELRSPRLRHFVEWIADYAGRVEQAFASEGEEAARCAYERRAREKPDR